MGRIGSFLLQHKNKTMKSPNALQSYNRDKLFSLIQKRAMQLALLLMVVHFFYPLTLWLPITYGVLLYISGSFGYLIKNVYPKNKLISFFQKVSTLKHIQIKKQQQMV